MFSLVFDSGGIDSFTISVVAVVEEAVNALLILLFEKTVISHVAIY